MAITTEVVTHQVRILGNGDLQAHETYTVSDNGSKIGEFNNVRIVDMEADTALESQIIQDAISGLDTPSRRAERAEDVANPRQNPRPL